MGLVKRWAFFDNSFRLNKKNISDSKVLAWATKTDKQDKAKISKQNLRKFEDIFLGVGHFHGQRVWLRRLCGHHRHRLAHRDLLGL